MLKERKSFREQHRELSPAVNANLKMGNWTQGKKIGGNFAIEFMRTGFFPAPTI